MPKIIVTSTFRKGGGAGKKGGAGGLLKYMGTREGVDKLPLSKVNAPATKRQQSLIESVIRRIPDTAIYPEYQDFLETGTKGAANEFLNSVLKQEEEAEKIGKLVTYMAERFYHFAVFAQLLPKGSYVHINCSCFAHKISTPYFVIESIP